MSLISYNKIKTNKKIIINIFIFVILVFLISKIIIIPTINNIKKLRADIITQKIDLEKKIVREKNMNLLEEKFEKIEPEVIKFEQIFINQSRELEFITTLEDIASENHIKQKINLNQKVASITESYKKIPITLEIQGGFKNILEYLTNLESSNYYINIEIIEISKDNGSLSSEMQQPSNESVNLKITANTYWK